jgi:hypothetical protein
MLQRQEDRMRQVSNRDVPNPERASLLRAGRRTMQK